MCVGITELRHAHDTTLFSTTPEGLNNLVQAVHKHSAAYKLPINAAKTKIMELDKWQENTNIVIDNINVERVQNFVKARREADACKRSSMLSLGTVCAKTWNWM